MTGAGIPDLQGVERVVGPLLGEAGRLSLRWFRSGVAAQNKAGPAGYDPVTEADRAVEELLRTRLSTEFPDWGILGEEGGRSGPDKGIEWCIDPIDGTRAFVTGMPLWGILVGLIAHGEAVAGWCHVPFLDETYWGLGDGAWCERHGEKARLATSPTTRLGDAAGMSTTPDMFDAPEDARRFEAVRSQLRMHRFGGDCYSYCLLAAGHIDVVIESGLRSYDIVPLIPIVRGAGGTVCDPSGRTPSGGFVVAAANETLRDQLLSLF